MILEKLRKLFLFLEQEEDPADVGGEETGGDTDPAAGGDIPGFEGPGAEQPPINVGRMYELKKIYSRLVSLESYLSFESVPQLLEIRSTVVQAIELFELVASNLETFKEQVDEIIVLYYKFIKEIYQAVKEQYQLAAEEK